MSDDPIRLVDVRAVLHIIGNAYDDSADFTSADYVRIRRQVEALPSVDAVPVVRCKECKHYQFADNRAFGFPVKRCEWTGFEDVDDEDFCSRGERKDGDHHEG